GNRQTPYWISPPAHYAGLWRSWYANGALWEEAEYTDGKLNGRRSAWHQDGTKSFQCTYAMGDRHGELLSWHANGAKEREEHYDHDKRDGKFASWNEQGQLQEDQVWKQSVPYEGVFLGGRVTKYSYPLL